MTPWLDAKTYYTRRWGQPVGRVGVDGGFSCPNRSGGAAGCTFCAEQGNRPPYQAGVATLEDQIDRGVAFQRERYGFEKFSLYFQAFTSTWAPVDVLRSLYDRGLARADFVDLTVGTRSDCLGDDEADLLASYRPQREVWVELGLQSSRDVTLRRIRRGHDVASVERAVRRLNDRDLPFTLHLMYGLPGEGKAEFLESVRFALALGASGLKLHDLRLVPGTFDHAEWKAGRLAAVRPELYLDAAADAVATVPPDVVVWRVRSDPEDRTRGEAGGSWPKNRFLNELRSEVLKRQNPSGRQGGGGNHGDVCVRPLGL